MHDEVGITSISTHPLPFFSRITQILRKYGVLYFLPDILHIHTVSARFINVQDTHYRLVCLANQQTRSTSVQISFMPI